MDVRAVDGENQQREDTIINIYELSRCRYLGQIGLSRLI